MKGAERWRRASSDVLIPQKIAFELPEPAYDVVPHLLGPDGTACMVEAALDAAPSKRVLVQTPVSVRGILTLTYLT